MAHANPRARRDPSLWPSEHEPRPLVTALRSVALNCTLKRSPSESSTGLILDDVGRALAALGVETAEPIRIADHSVPPGVASDEGDGDDWPRIRRQILDADILVFGTPIWLGHASSLAQRVLERMDAFLGEADDVGRLVSYGRVAIIAVVGNEDGAHHVTAELAQGLNDVGFTVAASAGTYWVGEAMASKDYNDFAEPPGRTAQATATAAANAVHVAGLLRANPYPAVEAHLEASARTRSGAPRS
ncbi:MAG: NAD(P)H-dependent oxidoreductase [Actinobacteria bacterium]|nr:NAD(P)H-dependent oxidoreductase [Actinomycetota bacterium]